MKYVYYFIINFIILVLMDVLYNIALTRTQGVGHVTAKALIAHFGTAEAIFKAKKRQLLQLPGIGERTARLILGTEALTAAEQDLRFIEKHKIETLFYTDANYPKRLRNCYDAPVLLYYKGTADLNQQRIISIVGTRQATEYGRELCRQLITTLQPYNVLLVSGLAYGIDVAAHKACIATGTPTVGVLGHGLDRIYPGLHLPVAQKMVLNGGLLTEFLPGTVPDKENFPKRNRIIAGMADAVVVVEASAKGGALITAELANSYSRDVYAFPGRTNDACSAGCNFLIKTNRAGLICTAKDLVYYLGWDDVRPSIKKSQPELLLDPYEQKIVAALQNNNLPIDILAQVVAIPFSKLSMLLLALEMKGILVGLPGKMYQLN